MRIRHIKGVEELIAKDPYIIQEPAAFKGCWSKNVFGNEAPVYLEVGMGMGTFVRTHSFLHPDINYIGLELNTTVLYKAVKRYEAELKAHRNEDANAVESGEIKTDENEITADGIEEIIADSNIRFIRENARFLTDYFGAEEVDRIYLNFSDPWPKDKNANKRLTSPIFLKLYDQILKKDGVIEFKTDNRILFDYSVETLPANGWQIREITYDLHNDAVMNEGNVMTEYEAKFSAKGNPIFKLIASR